MQSPPSSSCCCVVLRMLASAQALPQAAELIARMVQKGVPITASVAAQVLSALDLQASLSTEGFHVLLQV
jgi:hypothetical protein